MRPARHSIPGFRPALDTRALVGILADAVAGESEQGAATERFEGAFADLVGLPCAVALSSVRLGLYHVLQAMDLPRGSAVLTTPLTVRPVIDAILASGCEPRWVDLDPDTLSMDLAVAAERLTPDVRAVLVTHLWGVPSDLLAIRRFADEHGLVMLEDASQCLGGRVGGRPVGSVGDAALFSLGITKSLSALTGAIMVTDDETMAAGLRQALAPLPSMGRPDFGRWAALALLLRTLTGPRLYRAGGAVAIDAMRRSGAKGRVEGSVPSPTAGEHGALAGVQSRFGDLQAGAALRSLARWQDDERRRRAIVRRYQAALAGFEGLGLPPRHPDHLPGTWAYPVFHGAAPRLIRELRRRGVEALPSSVDACHELPGAPDRGVALPVATRLQREYVQLPLHPGLDPGDVEHVLASVRQAIASMHR